MNEIQRWKKAEDLKKECIKAKARLLQIEEELAKLRKGVHDWRSPSNSFTATFKGNLVADKVQCNELWLNERIYLDATGFHTINERNSKETTS